MKVVKWDEVDPKNIVVGDVIKWEQTCEECGHLRKSNAVTVIKIDRDLVELTVGNHGEEQTWDIFDDVKYLRKRQEAE